jgi:predicted MFS family arabinose efflux permease
MSKPRAAAPTQARSGARFSHEERIMATPPADEVATRRNFWTVALTLTMAFWASGAPSIIYPLYAARWDLTPAVTTAIFAVYPLVLVVVLTVFGNLSDYIGRRNALLAGLAFLLAGTALFALAPGIAFVFPARILQGIGVGLAVGSGSAALVDYNPYSPTVPGPLNSAVQSIGLTLAILIGAILVQYAPDPLHLSYWVLAGAFVVCAAFTLLLPTHNPIAFEAAGNWRPQGLRVPRGLGRPYVLASVALAAGFAVGAVFLSLGSDIEKVVLHSANTLEAGLVLCLSTVLVLLGAGIAKRVSTKIAVILGAALTIAMSGALVGAAVTSMLALFVIACAFGGPAVGLLVAGAVGTGAAAAPAHHRAQLLSAVFLVGYVVQGGLALAGGGIATSIGLAGATIWIALITTVFAAVAAILTVAIGTPPSAPSTPAKPESIGLALQ